MRPGLLPDGHAFGYDPILFCILDNMSLTGIAKMSELNDELCHRVRDYIANTESKKLLAEIYERFSEITTPLPAQYHYRFPVDSGDIFAVRVCDVIADPVAQFVVQL